MKKKKITDMLQMMLNLLISRAPMLLRLKSALRALLHRQQAERELDEELRYHIEQQTEQNNSDLLRLVIRQEMLPAIVGMTVGLGAAVALTRLMKSLLFEVSATDPSTFAVIVPVLLSVSCCPPPIL
jgi:hypothetical protein